LINSRLNAKINQCDYSGLILELSST